MEQTLPRRRWTVMQEGPDRPVLCEAVWLGQRVGWCYYRDLATGREWAEQGQALWFDDPESAVRRYILLNHPGDGLAVELAEQFGPGLEGLWRRTVRACRILARLWQASPPPAEADDGPPP